MCPKTFYRYVDDSHARFNEMEEADRFLLELNSQDPKIQYTVEKENNGQLAFLDVTITNGRRGSYEFQIFRKEAITNVQIKPNSSKIQLSSMVYLKVFLSEPREYAHHNFFRMK